MYEVIYIPNFTKIVNKSIHVINTLNIYFSERVKNVNFIIVWGVIFFFRFFPSILHFLKMNATMCRGGSNT